MQGAGPFFAAPSHESSLLRLPTPARDWEPGLSFAAPAPESSLPRIPTPETINWVWQEVAKLNKEDASICLMAARLCYERLSFLDKGPDNAAKENQSINQVLSEPPHDHYFQVHEINDYEKS